MYPKKNVYLDTSLKNFAKDERSLKIMQRAKSFGIDIFENETLAQELFNLEVEDYIDKKIFEKFIFLTKQCEQAIIRAQMSS
jgi:type III secretion system FlhB-like substrate exporter